MSDSETIGSSDRTRHDYLSATEKHQIITGEITLEILQRKERGWGSFANDAINNQIQKLEVIADRLTDPGIEDEVRGLIRKLNEAIPDSFVPDEVKLKK